MRSELECDNGEADSKLKSLEKHLQEVHSSLQILGGKQELAETQKEPAKLQFVQKESSAVVHEERTAVSATESKKADDANDTSNTQLALTLPNQVAPQSSHAIVQQQAIDPSALPLSQNLNQVPPYYLSSTQLPNSQNQAQHSYVQADAQCRAPYLGPEAHQQSQTQVNQTPQTQQFPHYQQQWSQQANQPVQQPQPPPLQSQNQVRPQSLLSSVYHPYVGAQPTNYLGLLESMASSMPMKVSFPGIPQQGVSCSETMPYSYGGSGRPVQPQPSPQQLKGGFPSQPGDGYTAGRSHPPMTSGGTYMLYDNEGARPHLLPQSNHYSHDTYSLGHAPLPTLLTNNTPMIRSPSPHFVRNHPHNELIDKLVSMGFRGDHVVGVIQRLEDSGQPVDFNAVLDRLNGNPSGGSQGAW